MSDNEKWLRGIANGDGYPLGIGTELKFAACADELNELSLKLDAALAENAELRHQLACWVAWDEQDRPTAADILEPAEMSDVLRISFDVEDKVGKPDPEGGYVRYEDYKALESRLDQLEKHRVQAYEEVAEISVENHALKSRLETCERLLAREWSAEDFQQRDEVAQYFRTHGLDPQAIASRVVEMQFVDPSPETMEMLKRELIENGVAVERQSHITEDVKRYGGEARSELESTCRHWMIVAYHNAPESVAGDKCWAEYLAIFGEEMPPLSAPVERGDDKCGDACPEATATKCEKPRGHLGMHEGRSIAGTHSAWFE
jgi:hypothetical protein